MGKLEICVHKCDIFHNSQYPNVNPRVIITVDNVYRFQTRIVSNSLSPSYEETFHVGNIHHLSKIEVSVWHVPKTKILDFNSAFSTLGIGTTNAIATDVERLNDMSSPQSNPLDNPSPTCPTEGYVLLGHCYLSIQRLTRTQEKTRSYILGTLPRAKNEVWVEDPVGVAGMISITFYSDTLGHSPDTLQMNEDLESETTQQLKRLLLRCDLKKIPVIDVILSNVRDSTELVNGVRMVKPKVQPILSPKINSSDSKKLAPEVINKRHDPTIGIMHPDNYESFAELMSRVCREYQAEVPKERSVSLTVLGCSNLDWSAMNKPVASASHVYVVLRTSCQEYVTEAVKLHTAVSWSSSTFTFDVIDLDSFSLFVILMGRVGSKSYEVGHTRLGVCGLHRHHSSMRSMFLYNSWGSGSLKVLGTLRILLRPMNFDQCTTQASSKVDQYYNRIGLFLKRYDPMLLPKADMLIRSRIDKLDELMNDFITLYGFEPNVVKLKITIHTINALRENVTTELHKKRVLVILTLGSVSFRTKSHEVTRFVEVRFEETYTFDVVRETDFIRLDVVKQSDPSVVYGSVEYTCINMERGTANTRRLYLVGNAGEANAYLSGMVRISLYSDNLGFPYRVDEELENIYTGRLGRYAQRYFPESLHSISLATLSIFDMESFMAELSASYHAEEPTYAVYMTILGCRQLASGFGGTNPYVVARLGIDSYTTKWIKDSTEPDFFEFTEFYTDRLSGKCITLIVMDHSEIGQDREIGYVVLSLENVQLGELYHDFEPLQPFTKSPKQSSLESGSVYASAYGSVLSSSGSAADGGARCTGFRDTKKMLGLVGFKFSVINLKFIDETRVRIARREHSHHHGGHPHTNDVAQNSMQPVRYVSIHHHPLSLSESEQGDGGNTDAWVGSLQDLLRHAGAGFKVLNKALKFVTRRSALFLEQLQYNIALTKTGAHSNASFTSVDRPSVELIAKRPTFDIMDRIYASFGAHFMSKSSENKSFGSNPEACLGGKPQTVSEFTTASSLAPQDNGQMLLYVRVLFCNNLIHATSRCLNPYVLLFTTSATYRTSMNFETADPSYTEEFVFRVHDPREDFLQIYVLTDTAYGVKQIGHCVLSLCNVRRDHAHTRRAALVVDSNTPNAFEHGSVCVLLMARNFGLQYLPSADAESRLREQIQGYLVHSAPSQLHWREWFVGMYADLSRSVLAHLFGSYYLVNKSKPFSDLKVGIEALSKVSCNNMYVRGNCVVKLKVGSRTYAKTHTSVGVDGFFKVDQALDVTLEHIESAILRLVVVINGKLKCGESWISLADLHRGVVQQRTHMLVQNVRSTRPFACGLITVSLLSYDFGSYSEPPSKDEEAVYTRLQRYLSYYRRAELIKADIIFSSIFNPNAYLRKLIHLYGPDPGDFVLRVTVKRCANLYFSNYPNNAGPEVSPGRSRRSLSPFCVLRCGLDEYRTQICEGTMEWFFNETFTLHVGLPELEVIELIVLNLHASKSVEIGRTRVSLDKLKRGVVNCRKLLLVSNAGTNKAVVNGIVELDLFSNDIGVAGHASPSNAYEARTQSPTLLSIGGFRESGSLPDLPVSPAPKSYAEDDSELTSYVASPAHRDSNLSPVVDALSATFSSAATRGLPHLEFISRGSSDSSAHEEADIYPYPNMASLTCEQSISNGASSPVPSTTGPLCRETPSTQRMVAITIVGFTFSNVKEVPSNREMYVRVMEGERVVFRTSPMPFSKLISLGRTFRVAELVLHRDTVLTLKVGVKTVLHNVPLCYADFCFTQCHKKVNPKNLRLYNPDHLFVGTCHLKIVVPESDTFPSSTVQKVAPQVLELVTDDVASFAERYSPHSLQGLDVSLSRACDIRKLHQTLRKKLAPEVIATVYVLIHSIDLHNYSFENNCAVAVSVGNCTDHSFQQLPVPHGGKRLAFFPYGMSRRETQTLLFCPMRVDISSNELSIPMKVSIFDGWGKSKAVEVGQCTVSLRALLTPEMYDLSEHVHIPLVRVRHNSNSMQTTPIGSLSFSIIPSAYERYLSLVCFPGTVASGFSRRYVRYYEKRIANFMRHYQVAELGKLHNYLYEIYVAHRNWREGLPDYLSELVEQWGQEVGPFEPVPVID